MNILHIVSVSLIAFGVFSCGRASTSSHVRANDSEENKPDPSRQELSKMFKKHRNKILGPQEFLQSVRQWTEEVSNGEVIIVEGNREVSLQAHHADEWTFAFNGVMDLVRAATKKQKEVLVILPTPFIGQHSGMLSQLLNGRLFPNVHVMSVMPVSLFNRGAARALAEKEDHITTPLAFEQNIGVTQGSKQFDDYVELVSSVMRTSIASENVSGLHFVPLNSHPLSVYLSEVARVYKYLFQQHISGKSMKVSVEPLFYPESAYFSKLPAQGLSVANAKVFDRWVAYYIRKAFMDEAKTLEWMLHHSIAVTANFVSLDSKMEQAAARLSSAVLRIKEIARRTKSMEWLEGGQVLAIREQYIAAISALQDLRKRVEKLPSETIGDEKLAAIQLEWASFEHEFALRLSDFNERTILYPFGEQAVMRVDLYKKIRELAFYRALKSAAPELESATLDPTTEASARVLRRWRLTDKDPVSVDVRSLRRAYMAAHKAKEPAEKVLHESTLRLFSTKPVKRASAP